MDEDKIFYIKTTRPTVRLFKLIVLKLQKKDNEYFNELVLREAKKHKIDGTAEIEPTPSDSTLSTAHKFIYASKPLTPLSPAVGRYKDTNLSCAIAWLHYYVINAFGSRGHPEKKQIRRLAFQISTDEVNGAKEYMKYFRKHIVPLEDIAKNKEMYAFAKQIQKRLKQD